MPKSNRSKGFIGFMVIMLLLLALGVWALVEGIVKHDVIQDPPPRNTAISGEATGRVC